MRLELVVAMARGRVIGRDNTLPWRLPEDLRHFRELTMGNPVVMGRLTWESIGKPLPGRLNIVISARTDLPLPEGVLRAPGLDGAVGLAAASGAARCMVIGGARVYAEALPRADAIHLTEIDLDVAGDTYFPALPPGQWRETGRVEGPTDSPSGLRFRFLTLERADSSR